MASAAQDAAHDAGGIVNCRYDPRIIEPGGADHSQNAHDMAGGVAIGCDDGVGTRQREQFVFRADENPHALGLFRAAQQVDHATFGLKIVEQQPHPLQAAFVAEQASSQPIRVVGWEYHWRRTCRQVGALRRKSIAVKLPGAADLAPVSGAPSHSAAGEACTPAAQMIVAAASLLPPKTTPSALHSETGRPSTTSTPSSSSERLA